MTGRTGANPPTPKPSDTTGSEAPHGTTPITDMPMGVKGKRTLSPPKTTGRKTTR